MDRVVYQRGREVRLIIDHTPPRIYAIHEEERRVMEQRESAAVKAKTLLDSILTDEQKNTLKKLSYIPVKGGLSGTTYLVRVGYSQNILAKGMSIARMTELGIRIGNMGGGCTCADCVPPRDRVVCCYMRLMEVPYWDHMIAQVLGLQYAEREFLRVAYVS